MAEPTTPAAPAAQPLPVTPGMGDLEAGEGFARYIEAAGGDDIDLFDGAEQEAVGEPEKKKPAQASASDESETDSADASEEEEEVEASADSDDEDAESVDADAETETIESAALAAALGVDDSALSVREDGTVAVKTLVDGVAGEATLQELVKGYQLEANVTRKSQQLAEERRGLREAAQEREEQAAAVVHRAAALGETLRGRVLAKYEAVPWEQLRTENPGEFSAMHTQMQQEMQAINYELENLEATRAQQQQRYQQEKTQQRQEWIAEEQRKLFEVMPDLADPAKRAPILTGYQEYLLDYGFEAEEITNILDHRQLRVIDDAVAYRKLMKEQQAPGKKPKVPVAKRLAKVPRVMKAGSGNGKETRKTTNRTQSLKRFKASGSDDDAARFAIDSGLVDSLL